MPSHPTKNSQQPTWASRLGFIMTAAGASVGLGNLQRFPQLVAKHGGGTFVLLYLASVLLLGWPLMLAEMSLGKATQTNPIHAFNKAKGKNTLWRYVGAFGVLIAFAILSYYMVCCSWTLALMIKSAQNMDNLDNLSQKPFEKVAAQPLYTLPVLIVFHFFVTGIVFKGLNVGIEQFSRVVMPLLLLLQTVLIIKIIHLPKSWQGIVHYLTPDFSQIKTTSMLAALSQAFFSLCIGEAILLVYGSYAPPNQNLVASAGYIALLDTVVALLAGFIIIPAMFITEQPPHQGVSLVYNTLFALAKQLQGGGLFLMLYFMMLAIAGVTTCIGLLDIVSYTLSKNSNVQKSRATLIVSFLALLLSIPSLYAKGGSSLLSNTTFLRMKGFYDIMDFVWGSIGMLVCGLLTTLFVGWVWGADKASKALAPQADFFKKIKAFWTFHVRWIAPCIVVALLISLRWTCG